MTRRLHFAPYSDKFQWKSPFLLPKQRERSMPQEATRDVEVAASSKRQRGDGVTRAVKQAKLPWH